MSQNINSGGDERNNAFTPSQKIMEDFRHSLAGRTKERHFKELEDFRLNLEQNGKNVGNLANDAANWSDVIYSDIADFLYSLGERGYKITSIRDKFYTLRTYARLAMQAGFFNQNDFKLLDKIKPSDILRKLNTQNLPSLSKRKSEPFILTEEQVHLLLTQPETLRGKTDALLLALLLHVGLWPREISALNRRSIDLERGTLSFYDYHFGEEQICKLDDFTLEIATRYLQEYSPYEALFVGNRKESTNELRLTDRAINARIRAIGKKIGIQALSPHDCHLYWEKHYKFSRNSLDSSSTRLIDINSSSKVKSIPHRKVRPDLFNRRMFEAMLLDHGVPESLVPQMISDIRLLVPLLIQQIGEETFQKIAIEHRSKLIPGSETEIWEQTVHHLVTWAENEMERYFHETSSPNLLSKTKEEVVMPKRVREVIKEIESDGWYLLPKSNGSHRQFKHSEKKGRVTIAGNLNDELHPKTLARIYEQAQLNQKRQK